MSSEHHQRAPESLAREMWFYSLPRRAQTTDLRRVTFALIFVALVFTFVATLQRVATAGAIGAVVAVVMVQTLAYLRSTRQKESVLTQLETGMNPQVVDVVGSSASNRSLVLRALQFGLGVALICFALIVWVL